MLRWKALSQEDFWCVGVVSSQCLYHISLVWAGSSLRKCLRKCTLLQSHSDPARRIWGSVPSCHTSADILKQLMRAESIWGFRLCQHCILQLLAFGFYSAVQSPKPPSTWHRNCILNLASFLKLIPRKTLWEGTLFHVGTPKFICLQGGKSTGIIQGDFLLHLRTIPIFN